MDKSRVEAFSNGLSVVVTLLVFDVKLAPLNGNNNASVLVAIGQIMPKVLI